MNLIIPFKSTVKFQSEVKEICRISLEHEITQNEDEILGTFYVTGAYKEHQLSVNTIDFNFAIPFSVELAAPIEKDTLDFSIDNFTYDINKDEMIVKIDYIVKAEEKIIEDPVDLISREIADVEEFSENLTGKNNEETKEEDREEQEMEKEQETCEQNIKTIEPVKEEIRNEVVNNEEIKSISNAMTLEDDYLTYHVHIVKESETIDSIAMMYKLDKEDILSLNKMTEIVCDDKLLIPISNELN